MEDQWDLMLGSPTAKHGASPFMPEVEYPSLPLDLLCGLNNYMNFHGHSQETGIPASSSTPGPENSPTVSPASSGSPTTQDTSEPKAARRRIQNREAQRRFRERKEQRKNSLQKNAEELHRDYQTLLTQYADTVSDVTRLVQENGVLRFEIRKLRQQWRLLLTIIQRLQGSQSPGASRESAFNFDDVQDYLEDLGSGLFQNTTCSPS
ncbi:Hypothetical protein PENO1_010920 [Penicillium occitanis (nom. inval.)]|nr:hypothetical protein PENOC_071720 [Penicillium occitanis (nom. inval.)]PCH07731.1 Hypothetical protein PENO1_010920 [Penicillium occitanis (nom. inval.)]